MTLGLFCGLFFIAFADDAKLPTAVELLRIAESHRTDMKPSEDFCRAYFAVGEAEKALKEVGPKMSGGRTAPIDSFGLYSRRTGKRAPSLPVEAKWETIFRSVGYIDGLASHGKWEEATAEYDKIEFTVDAKRLPLVAAWVCRDFVEALLRRPDDPSFARGVALSRRVIAKAEFLMPIFEPQDIGAHVSAAKSPGTRAILEALATRLEQRRTYRGYTDSGVVWAGLGDRMRAGACFRQAAFDLETYCANAIKPDRDQQDFFHLTFTEGLADVAVRQVATGFVREGERNFRIALDNLSAKSDTMSPFSAHRDLAKAMANVDRWQTAQELLDLQVPSGVKTSSLCDCARSAFRRNRKDLAERWFKEAEKAASGSDAAYVARAFIQVSEFGRAEAAFRGYFAKWGYEQNPDRWPVLLPDCGASMPTEAGGDAAFDEAFVRFLVANAAVDEAWKRLQRAKDWSKPDLATTYAKLSLAVSKRELSK